MNITSPLTRNKDNKDTKDTKNIKETKTEKESKEVKEIQKKKIQNKLLLNSLIGFYKKKSNIKAITQIVNGNTKVSLRLIDWFVTNYCKKNTIFITKYRYKNKEQINIYTDYRAQLKAYSKQLFDPFRRRERINFYFDTNEYFYTTTGQLNFFRWAIENNILKYIEENLAVIEKDMIQSQKKNQEKKNNKENLNIKILTDEKGTETTVVRKKRNELSKSKCKNITYNVSKRLISFE